MIKRIKKRKHYKKFFETYYKIEEILDGLTIVFYRLCAICGNEIDLEQDKYKRYNKTNLYIHEKCKNI